jgi:hypothetical protein
MRFVVASLLILSAIVAAQQSSPKKSPRQGSQQHNQANDKNVPLGPAQTAPICVPSESNVQIKTESPQQKTSNWVDWFWPPEWANWALVAVGAWAAWIALGTLEQIRQETKHSGDLAKSAQTVAEGVLVNANVAKEHADATRETVQTLMVGQRAWITVTMGAMPDFTPDPSTMQILWLSPTFTNCGKTPARIIRIRAREEEIPNGQQLPEPPIYEGVGVSPARFDGTAFLPPNASIQPINIGMVPAAFIAIRQGNPVLYLYGFVDYRDVYDRQWTTRFCFIYHIQSGFNPISEGFYVGGPAAYNEAT